jgi:membrane protease YdiL (CAAX protease family)
MMTSFDFNEGISMTAELQTGPSSIPAAQPETAPRQSWWKTHGTVLAGFIPLFLVLEFGPTLLLPRIGQTWAVLVAAAVMLGLAVVIERLLFKYAPSQALRQLGYGRPGWRAVVVALILSGVMLLFFPVLSFVSGARLSLKSDWLWILAGIIAFNGLAEETLFRGYAFGNLRRVNSFLRAGFLSLILFAAAHLFLFAANPFAIALAGTLVAVSSAYPLAYLFERGRSTVWAPAIWHAATHVIRLVDLPESLYLTAVVVWLVMQIGLPLLVFAFYKYLKD